MPVTVLSSTNEVPKPVEEKKCRSSEEANNPLYQKHYPLKSLVQCNLNECTREQIRDYFINTYDLNELVFSALKDESYFVKCPDRLRLPLIFYLAHTASVYINKLMLAGLIHERVNNDFEIMFETGVDEMSWDDTENYRMGGSFKWPSVSDVLSYRQEVRKVVLDVIDSAPLQLPVTTDHPWWSLFMGMEHERIHLETSSVLIRQLPVNMVQRPDNWKYAPTSIDTPVGPNEFVEVRAGRVTVGKPLDFPSYGWDNEYGKAEIDVPKFEATKYLITNKEFLEFVKERGYRRRDLWTEEGWKWVEFRQACHPTFWVCDKGCKSGCGADLTSYSHCATMSHDQDESYTNGNGKSHDQDESCTNGNGKSHDQDESYTNGNGKLHDQDESCTNGNGKSHDQDESYTNGNGKSHESCTNGDGCKYKYRAIYDVIDMPWDWPVDINCHEAKAFCTWKGPGYRLPTEAEHHRMRGDEPPRCDVTCDPSFNPGYPANIGLKYGSSTPVNMFPPTSAGFHDVYGNVWEWTEDHFNGLPGFKTTYLYDDFSAPCFDGRHTMMMGGSWISTGAGGSRFARFAFRRHFFQHLGFRLVRSNAATPARICKAEVFVLGAGVTDNPIITPHIQEDKCIYNSTNNQFRYESEKELDSKLNMEYGNIEKNGYPLSKFVEGIVEKYRNGSAKNAVIFGSGTGVTSFLLTKTFEKVIGVEYSGRFIDAAQSIQSGKELPYGDGKMVASIPVGEGVDPSRVIFKQMTWVPNEIEGFDMVVFDFLDRLNEPRGWLIKLWECLLPGGIVVIKASETWRNYLQKHIGMWFDFCENAITPDNQEMTVWQLRK